MTKINREIRLDKPPALLENNPKISLSVVSEYRSLEKKLEKLGVDTRPHYTLSHPFSRFPLNALMGSGPKPQ